MRHLRARGKLGVKTKHRKAMLRNMVRNLVLYKRIRTTVVRAKQVSAFADKMIQIAKKGDLHARRNLISYIGCVQTADQLIEKIAPKFKERSGGYTRVLKLGKYRPGDATDVALLEFTVQMEPPAKPEKKVKKKKKPEAQAAAPVQEEAPKKGRKAKGKEKEKEKESAPEAEKTSTEEAKEKEKPEDKKETEKKGGFLGALRQFLKGDQK